MPELADRESWVVHGDMGVFSLPKVASAFSLQVWVNGLRLLEDAYILLPDRQHVVMVEPARNGDTIEVRYMRDPQTGR